MAGAHADAVGRAEIVAAKDRKDHKKGQPLSGESPDAARPFSHPGNFLGYLPPATTLLKLRLARAEPTGFPSMSLCLCGDRTPESSIRRDPCSDSVCGAL